MLAHSSIFVIFTACLAVIPAKQYERATWSTQGRHFVLQVRELCPISSQTEHFLCFPFTTNGHVRLLCPHSPHSEHRRPAFGGVFSGQVRLLCPHSAHIEHMRLLGRSLERSFEIRISAGVAMSLALTSWTCDKSSTIDALCCNGQVRLLCEVSKQTEHGMVANDSERLHDPRVCSDRLLINDIYINHKIKFMNNYQKIYRKIKDSLKYDKK